MPPNEIMSFSQSSKLLIRAAKPCLTPEYGEKLSTLCFEMQLQVKYHAGLKCGVLN